MGTDEGKSGEDSCGSAGSRSPNLREFARDILDGFPDSFPDGFDIQDSAVKHGLLVPHRVTAPCGPVCQCVEYHGEEDMAEGVTCYRLHDSLFAAMKEQGND